MGAATGGQRHLQVYLRERFLNPGSPSTQTSKPLPPALTTKSKYTAQVSEVRTHRRAASKPQVLAAQHPQPQRTPAEENLTPMGLFHVCPPSS